MRIQRLFCLSTLLLGCCMLPVQAEEAPETAPGEVREETARKGVIQIVLEDPELPEELTIEAFRVGTCDTEGDWKLLEKYAGIELKTATSEEMLESAEMLAEAVENPDFTLLRQGSSVRKEGVEPGLWLFCLEARPDLSMQPFLLSLPCLNAAGELVYEAEAAPKFAKKESWGDQEVREEEIARTATRLPQTGPASESVRPATGTQTRFLLWTALASGSLALCGLLLRKEKKS